MTVQVRPRGDLLDLAPSEWKDWTGAEEVLSRLARSTGADRYPGAIKPERFVPPAPERRLALLRYPIAIGIGIGLGAGAAFAWHSLDDGSRTHAIAAASQAWTSYGEPARQKIASSVPPLLSPGPPGP